MLCFDLYINEQLYLSRVNNSKTQVWRN